MKIAFFSDIHANLPALHAFFEDIERVKPDMIYCLGDLVGYNIWANEVVNEIKNRFIPTIMGNHDEAILLPIKEGDNSNRGITRRLITEENREYLTNLPRQLKFSFDAVEGKFNVLLVHGSPKSINDYLVEDYPESETLEMFEVNDVNMIICGHTHRPYHRKLKFGEKIKHVVNIGSVGKPKDGDPRICYAIINFKKDLLNDIEIIFRRVEYDLVRASNAILKSEFHSSYAKSLILAT